MGELHREKSHTVWFVKTVHHERLKVKSVAYKSFATEFTEDTEEIAQNLWDCFYFASCVNAALRTAMAFSYSASSTCSFGVWSSAESPGP
jgi:hypothetical protein